VESHALHTTQVPPTNVECHALHAVLELCAFVSQTVHNHMNSACIFFRMKVKAIVLCIDQIYQVNNLGNVYCKSAVHRYGID
jgi:hypothetical protein